MNLRFAILAGAACMTAGAMAHTFEIGDEAFLLDGKPFVIRCGEIHSARVPRAYWKSRLQLCRAMGLNTVCAYLFWNRHEPRPGEFVFDGEDDIAEFCRLAQAEGLWVILRPGPYACAEWEFGGFPAWLIKDGPIPLRTRDPRFLGPAVRYLHEVGKRLAPLQITRGGPILMVQAENEYGFFGKDGDYVRAIAKALEDGGFEIPVFTCNPKYKLKPCIVPEYYKAVNFGKEPEDAFRKQREVQPTGPLMCSEYYPAWYDTWSEKHQVKSAQKMLDDIAYMLSRKASFSIYMAHGGTTFGYWSGFNAPFRSITTSYDYDAPIRENGAVGEKFWRLRELLLKHLNPGETVPAPQEVTPPRAMALGEGAGEILSFADAVSGPEIRSHRPQKVEAMDIPFGTVIYRTAIPAGKGGVLKAKVRDFAGVFVDGEFKGFLDVRKPDIGVTLPAADRERKLELVVDHEGRPHFGEIINDAWRGLVKVTLDGEDLCGWSASACAVSPDAEWRQADASVKTPCSFRRWRFECKEPADTYIDVHGWAKGMVWVNGRNLGRYWAVGPTQTMYLPGCWLKRGENEIVVWDFAGTDWLAAGAPKGVDKATLDELHIDRDFFKAGAAKAATDGQQAGAM